ncbi:MAG: N-acyl homoserine lactone hydrolase [Candidatus Azotimanducaceae bacterium]|jgi:N-acyl homoserine lactone hydrolase
MNQLFLVIVALLLSVSSQISAASDADLRLYRLDCGRVHVDPMNVFSDTNAYPNRSVDLVDSCYLIKHNNDWMMWDAGLPAAVGLEPEGLSNGPFHLMVDSTLNEQLAQLNLKPEDITYVGISHAHFDHIGNVNLFQKATLLIQAAEYEFLANPKKARAFHMEPDLMSFFLQGEGTKQVRVLKGDADIFGDGTVKAISLPGHTPGHMALQIELPETGTVFLSGDQWHFTENHSNNGVPGFNFNRADTLASSHRLNGLVQSTDGKLIIQHEAKDNAILPILPEYLQ